MIGAPSSVDQIINRTGGPNFKSVGGQSSSYFPTAYNGVSGATATGYATFSLSGDYNTSITEYTHFFHFSGANNFNGAIVKSDNTTDYSGNTQGYRWFSTDDYNPADDFLRTFTFFTNGSSTAPEPDYTYSGNVWYKGAVRVFQTSNVAHTELWINGVLVDSTSQGGQFIITAVNPIFQFGGNGGPNFKISEGFFFNYKLTDVQMGQMFTYLNNKY